jgi:hypothetical protein
LKIIFSLLTRGKEALSSREAAEVEAAAESNAIVRGDYL